MQDRDRAGARLDHLTRPRLAAIVLTCAAALGAGAPARATGSGLNVELVPGLEASETSRNGMPEALLAVGDRFVYVAHSGGRLLLWASDGTESGTEVVRQLCVGCSLDAWVSTGTAVFFVVEGRLWRSDGSTSGTYPLMPFPGEVQTLVATRDVAYLMTCDGSECSLTASDGTVAGTRPVGGVPLDAVAIHDFTPLVVWNDEVYLLAYGGSVPVGSLWRLSAPGGEPERLRVFAGYPRCLAAVPSIDRLLFFTSPDTNAGRDLWASDGTAAGTTKLRHFQDLAMFNEGCVVADRGGRGWFVAYENDTGEQIWSTDGTVAGTVRATGFRRRHPFGFEWPGDPPTLPASQLAMAGSRLVFPALDQGERRLWTTNGRWRSARPITGCPGGCPNVSWAQPFAPLGGRVAFIGWRGCEPPAMWVTDGTGMGTVKVHEVLWTQYDVAWVTTRDDRWYLTAPVESADGYWEGGSTLLASDGTPGGTVTLASIDDVYEQSQLESMLVALDGRVFFSGCAGDDCGLLATDGQTVSAVRTVTFVPTTVLSSLVGRAGSHVLLLDVFANFRVADATGAVELDEEVTGTFSTGCGRDRIELAEARSRTFVLVSWACTVSFGDNFWSTDGTVAGTTALQPPRYATASAIAPSGERSAFYVDDTGSGPVLGLSDGTVAGTAPIVALPAGSATGSLVADDGIALFAFRESGGEAELWISDGTATGTHALATGYAAVFASVMLGGRGYALARQANGEMVLVVVDLASQAVSEVVLAGVDRAEALTAAAGRLWLAARGPDDEERTLWVSDGTLAGTQPLPAVIRLPRWDRVAPPLVTALGGAVYFVGIDAEHGSEIWRSDGTEAGTALVVDLAPGPANGAPETNLVGWAGRLWFTHDDAMHGPELWSSDGTAAGTRLALDLAAGPAGSSPTDLTVAADRLFFAAGDGVHGWGLWVADPATP